MKKAIKKASVKPMAKQTKLNLQQSIEKVHVNLIKKMFGFIYQLRQDEITNAAYFYLIERGRKDPSDGSFNKKQRQEFYAWLSNENEAVKERWTQLAESVYNDKVLSDLFIKELFKKSDIKTVTTILENSMKKYEHNQRKTK